MLHGLSSIAGLAVSICVGLAFAVAAFGKFRHGPYLAGVIANYRILPEPSVAIAARLLPIVELAIGIALILGEDRFAPPAAILMLLVFAAAMAINIRRGRRHIDCGCGQSMLRQQLSWPLVGRNLVLAALLAFRMTAGNGGIDSAGLAVAVVSGLSLYLLYLLFNTVTALFAAQPTIAST